MYRNLLFGLGLALASLANAQSLPDVVEAYGKPIRYSDANGNITGEGYFCPISFDIDLITKKRFTPMFSAKAQQYETHIVFKKLRKVNDKFVIIKTLEVIDVYSNGIYTPSIDKIITQNIGEDSHFLEDTGECKRVFDNAQQVVYSQLQSLGIQTDNNYEQLFKEKKDPNHKTGMRLNVARN